MGARHSDVHHQMLEGLGLRRRSTRPRPQQWPVVPREPESPPVSLRAVRKFHHKLSPHFADN